MVKVMARISSKNQVTLPLAALRGAGLAAGDDVQIVAAGPGRIEVVRTTDLVDRFAGILDSTTFPAGYLDDLRAGWR